MLTAEAAHWHKRSGRAAGARRQARINGDHDHPGYSQARQMPRAAAAAGAPNCTGLTVSWARLRIVMHLVERVDVVVLGASEITRR